MKHTITLIIILLLFHSVGFSQFKGDKPYIFSIEIYDSIKSNPQRWVAGITGPMLSFIGLYKEALFVESKRRLYVQNISKYDSMEFLKKYHAIDARQYIMEKAKTNRILIINEAHFNARNRVFIASLLSDLRKLGYKYYAAEGFWNNEQFPKKYPAIESGYYTKEPQFGNLIREAVKQKFILFPYEDTTGANGKMREINQAKHLADLLNNDPSGKVLIHCGYGHIYEDSVGGGWEKAMAGRLLEYTGINPFTIDQTWLAEKPTYETSMPHYRIINKDKYSFLIDSSGKQYNNTRVDAVLYSPPTRYLYRRPHWIFENNKKPYLLRNIRTNLDYPVLIKVYLNKEEIEKKYVPIDIIEIKDASEMQQTAVAVFENDKFIIEIENKKGNKQIFIPK